MTTKYLARVMQLVGVVAAMTIASPVTAAAAADVQMCHGTGNGDVHLITVNANAEPAHRAHGDAAPGDPLPSDSNYKFDAQCSPVLREANLTYPCWSTYTKSALLGVLSGSSVTSKSCMSSDLFVMATPNANATLVYATTVGACVLKLNGSTLGVNFNVAPADLAATCVTEGKALATSLNWCQ